jgi:polyamine oxidase
VRDALTAWITAECAGLYGAPLADMPANGGFEPYALPGGDHLVTSDLGALAERLAEGLDLRRRHRVGTLRRDGAHWIVDERFAVDAVIVSVPIGALRADRIRFDPGLPDDVRQAISALGAGPIVKIVALFDEAWWPPARPIRLSGGGLIGTVTDVSPAAGRPALACFAVGDAARSLEALSEHELCRTVDRAFAVVGLTEWDLPARS